MPDPGEQETSDLVDHLYGDWELRVWREKLNTRWVCFLTYRDQTYCLLPLAYEPVPGKQGDD